MNRIGRPNNNIMTPASGNTDGTRARGYDGSSGAPRTNTASGSCVRRVDFVNGLGDYFGHDTTVSISKMWIAELNWIFEDLDDFRSPPLLADRFHYTLDAIFDGFLT